MTKRHNLGDLRAAIEIIVRSIMNESECGEAPNDKVLARLKSERQPLVTFFTPQLVDIALTKLLNDVCKKKVSPIGLGEEDDLFGSYGKIPQRVTVTRGLKKDTANLTMFEAKQWLERHSDRLVESDTEDFKRLIDTIAPYAQSDDEAISDVFRRMQQRQHSQSRELLPAE